MPKNIAYPKNRRLKKSEIKDFIATGDAKLHQEFTALTYEKYDTGYEKKDVVYELPNGDFIYEFAESWGAIAGKGNYWERDAYLRSVRWNKKVEEDYKHGRASSVDHWKFYTKQGNELVKHEETNLESISKELLIDKSKLDFSYESLGIIDKAVEKFGVEKAIMTLYDALVFYVGQIIANRVDGHWKVDSKIGYDYPFITVEKSNLHYMPINIVWSELDGNAPCNMRKATAEEIRTNAFLHPKNN